METEVSSLCPTAGEGGEISTMTLSSSVDEESSVERTYLLLRPGRPPEGPAGAGVGVVVLAYDWRVRLLVGAAKTKLKKKKVKKK